MKAIGKLVLGALMLAGTTAAVAPAAQAQWYGGYGYGYGPGWGRPGASFSFGVGPSWRGGRWYGPRYAYPRPAYPYPGYLPPPVVDDYYGAPPPRDYAGGGYARGADPNPQRPQYWYFCENPEGYYPYVQDCENWQQEAAEGPRPPGDYPEYSDPDFQGDQ
jgi:hypothetical protein